MADAAPIPAGGESRADRPIVRSDDDRFERSRLAELIASEIRTAPHDTGYVIAVCGAWGSGKTSVTNLVSEIVDEDAGIVTVNFNPWMVSGTEGLVSRFFGELAAVLGKNDQLKDVATKIAAYSGALSGIAGFVPFAGGPLSKALEAAQGVLEAAGETPSLDSQRTALIRSLEAVDTRIVVFLDDIDRLTDAEVREMVKLVKLLGDLPRLIYVLAFDRARVEQALGGPEKDDGQRRRRGRAYLEKIVQISHDLPEPRPRAIVGYFVDEISEVVGVDGNRTIHEHDWGNLLGLALRHMIKTPRDAKRIANAVAAAIDLYDDEIAVVDLIGLESLHVLEPDVHSQLSSIRDILGNTGFALPMQDGQAREQSRARVNEVLESASDSEHTRILLGQLFPRAHSALGNSSRSQLEDRLERIGRRVAVPEVLDVYLHATLDYGTLSTGEIVRLTVLLDDPTALRTELASIGDEFVSDAVDALEERIDDLELEDPVETALVLLDQLPRMGEDESPLVTFKLPHSWSVRRVVWKSLRQVETDRREDAVVRMIEAQDDLSAKWLLVNWFGTDPEREDRDVDAELLGEEKTKQLLAAIAGEVRAKDPSTLAAEPRLAPLLSGIVAEDAENGQVALRALLDNDDLMLAFLVAYHGFATAQTMGEAAVRRRPRIEWPRIVELYGEDEIANRVNALAESLDHDALDDEEASALDLAVKHAAGEITPEERE